MNAGSTPPDPTPLSAVPGIAWPGLPNARGATMLAMQQQLAESQWWPPAELRRRQFGQLDRLLRHALDTVPFYRQRDRGLARAAGQSLSEEGWAGIPLLDRETLRGRRQDLLSHACPRDHGRHLELLTSGSTGSAVSIVGTELTHFFWLALTLRDHLWHRRDLTGTLAAVRSNVEDGASPGWGPATDLAFATGPSVHLNIRATVERQARWLAEQDPHYLLTYPSNLRALALHFKHTRQPPPPRLRELRTISESLDQETRDLCREVFGAGIVDGYSSQEVGCMALQCPAHEHYHVQSESLLLEVLDADGRPTEPGRVGRVTVTDLHNFAMPIIRYDIGDYAEVGPACPCGRGLPVLTRIMGRTRNLLTLPDGGQIWPLLGLGYQRLLEMAPVTQFQVVQKDLSELELKLVVARPLQAEEEDALCRHLIDRLGHPFRVRISYHAAIPRGPGGKYEDFRSEVATPAR